MTKIIILLLNVFSAYGSNSSLAQALSELEPPLRESDLPIIKQQERGKLYTVTLGEKTKFGEIECKRLMNFSISTRLDYIILSSSNVKDRGISCIFDGEEITEARFDKKFQLLSVKFVFSDYLYALNRNIEHLEKAKVYLKPFQLENKKFYLLGNNKEFSPHVEILLREPVTIKGILIEAGSALKFVNHDPEEQGRDIIIIQSIRPPKGKTVTVRSQECDEVELNADFSLNGCSISKDLTTQGITIPKDSYVNFNKNDFGKLVPDRISSLSKDIVIKGKTYKARSGPWFILPDGLKADEGK